MPQEYSPLVQLAQPYGVVAEAELRQFFSIAPWHLEQAKQAPALGLSFMLNKQGLAFVKVIHKFCLSLQNPFNIWVQYEFEHNRRDFPPSFQHRTTVVSLSFFYASTFPKTTIAKQSVTFIACFGSTGCPKLFSCIICIFVWLHGLRRGFLWESGHNYELISV